MTNKITYHDLNITQLRQDNEVSKAQGRNTTATNRIEKSRIYGKSKVGSVAFDDGYEKSYALTQREMRHYANTETSKKQFSLTLPTLGPYMCDYSINGASLLMAGQRGHISAMRWKSFSLQCEFQLNEQCSAIKYLHDEQLFAVAQSKYTYIYGNDGVEVHQLRDMANIKALEFLPQHFLLTGGGLSGSLTWFDVSVGKLASLRRSRMGSVCQIRRDKATNVLGVGHQCGQVTMWSPACPSPLIKIAAHRTSIVDLSFESSGTYMTTLGADGYTRIWDMRKMGILHQIFTPRGTSLDISHTNLLAIAFGSRVEIWKDILQTSRPTKPIIAHNFEKSYTVPTSVHFCPYEDVLGVGHNFGFSSLLVPGSGCADPDFFSANPYESAKEMRSRPVHQLLDKLPLDSIHIKGAIGASHTSTKNTLLLKKRKISSLLSDFKKNATVDGMSSPEAEVAEREVSEGQMQHLHAEAERLERQHRNERKAKKMDGVEKYKLKQRSQGRKEVRETRRLLKKKRADQPENEVLSSISSGDLKSTSAATTWFSQG